MSDQIIAAKELLAAANESLLASSDTRTAGKVIDIVGGLFAIVQELDGQAERLALDYHELHGEIRWLEDDIADLKLQVARLQGKLAAAGVPA